MKKTKIRRRLALNLALIGFSKPTISVNQWHAKIKDISYAITIGKYISVYWNNNNDPCPPEIKIYSVNNNTINTIMHLLSNH